MSQVLALASALFFGIGDFIGGYVTRRVSVWTVTFWSQVFGVPVLLAGLAVVSGSEATTADLAWGALAGVVGLVGIVIFYSTLARGAVAIVAPITGATGAALPVAFGLFVGETLTTLQVAGVVLAVLAIVLLSAHEGPDRVTTGQVAGAVVAGISFALFFVLLSRTSAESGLWPVAAARAMTLPLAGAVAVFSRAIRPPRGVDLRLVAAGGVLDMAANITIALSLQRGSLAVNAVLSSLYPAVTALLAIVLLEERPQVRQWVGLAAAMLAVAGLAV